MTRGFTRGTRARCLLMATMLTGAALAVAAGPADALAPSGTTLVSAPTAGAPTRPATSPSVSADGRYVAFATDASNLVSGDTNGVTDIFRRDTQTGTTIRVSVGHTGGQLTAASSDPAISANGRFIAFISESGSVVNGDTNDAPDAFLRDVQSGTTIRVSIDATGAEAPEGAGEVALSGDGRWVAFSTASALISTDTNEDTDIYARDTVANTTVRITTATGGWEPAVNGDGRYFAYSTTCGATGCVYRKDRIGGGNLKVSVPTSGTNPNGQSYNATITSDGTKMVFESEASNLVSPIDANGTVDIYLRNITTSTTTRVSVSGAGGETNEWSFEPSASSDGRYIAFISRATNLTSVIETDTNIDVYVRDLSVGTTARFSTSPFGTALDADSVSPNLAADGSMLAYVSFASNVITGVTARGQVYRTALTNFTAPTAPQNVSATGANASATVNWTAPASNGGSAITGYLVTSSPGGLTASTSGAATSAPVTGLTNGVTYTFTVRAQNSVGYGDASAASNAVTPTGSGAAAPAPPQNVSAVAADAAATVSWTAPASDGGSPITGYVVTGNPGGVTASGGPGATSAVVSGLANGTPYTFTVRAQNAIGDSLASAPSNSVTPTGGVAATTISVGDVSVVEGDTGARTVKLPVTLLRPATNDVSIDYIISGTTATGAVKPVSGVDFNDRGQKVRTLRFVRSPRTGLTPIAKYISVPVYSDGAPEGDETFQVTLANPTGGYAIGRAVGVGTILDDDGTPGAAVRAAVGDAKVMRAENGAPKVMVPVSLSQAATGDVSLSYSVAGTAGTTYSAKATGGDFGGKTTGTLTIKAGKVLRTINIPIWPSAISGPDKAIVVTLTGATGGSASLARAQGTVVILVP